MAPPCRPTGVKVVLVILCALTVVLLVLIAPVVKSPIEMAMTVVRTVGPLIRGTCLPRGEISPKNSTIGVLSFNGIRDELYEVSEDR